MKVYKLKNVLFLLFVVFVAGCASIKDLDYGISKLKEVNSKYNTTMDSFPSQPDKIDMMINDINNLKSIDLGDNNEEFGYILDYRIANSEAIKFLIQSGKYGKLGTTVGGFACKPRPLVIESAILRNMSAQKGYGAAKLMNLFAEKYPADAEKLNFSTKKALFMNADFSEIETNGRKDINTVNSLCPTNRTLELYKEDFANHLNLSKDAIDNLTYDEAVNIWKIEKGYR